MSVELHLAVNNGAGNLTGRVEAIDVWIDHDVAARFELGLGAVYKFRQYHHIRKIIIAKTQLDYIKYMTYAGNIMWNSYTIKAVDLHRLFNDLAISGSWNLIEAHTEIFEIWNSGRDFCPEDFGEQESEAAKLEAAGYQPLFDLGEVK